jgi:hypothetical protein
MGRAVAKEAGGRGRKDVKKPSPPGSAVLMRRNVLLLMRLPWYVQSRPWG